MNISKECKICKVNKPINDYYRNKKTTYYHSNCLQCVNQMRSLYITNKNYVKKLTGLAKYSQNVQDYVREAIRNKVDIKEISENSNIHKSTISNWIRNNKI